MREEQGGAWRTLWACRVLLVRNTTQDLMPTFEVLCAECDELRWPMLPERPSRYVCVRCHATPRDKKARLKAAAAKRKQSVKTA